MARQDCTKLLGKRVTFNLDWSSLGCSPEECIIKGTIIAVLKYFEGYERFDNGQVLFLEDGSDEPDFISIKHDFRIVDDPIGL